MAPVPAASQAGVYLLIGERSGSEKPPAYIGVGEDVGKRLRQHREEDFWVQSIVFVGLGDNLTKSHFQYLEGRLIKEAAEVGRFELQNDQDSGAKVSQAARADMEVFLSWVRQLLPVLCCKILIPVVKSEKLIDPSKALVFKVKGVTARGQQIREGFVVFKGSEATLGFTPSVRAWTVKTREELLKNGGLKELADKLVFTQDLAFTSPSAAAEIIYGGAKSGLTAWRNAEG
jgi:hypothetical protein